MTIAFSVRKDRIAALSRRLTHVSWPLVIVLLASVLSVGATIHAYLTDTIVAYGDAESHLNISKRVVDSLTPGFAQLGGIWLPLPHLLMAPFVYFDFLWRSGLAGSIVSGIAFVISALYLYKLAWLVTKSRAASVVSALVFMLNPNALYLQATPMTEVLLIAFQVLSSYFFIKFLQNKDELPSLLMAGVFGFCAVLTRYDGWFLVLLEAAAIGLYYLPQRNSWSKLEGRVIMFATLTFFGIFLWLLWGFLILGDPLYFTNSEFSAKSQQQSWLARGELPSYHNIVSAFLYYFVTAMSNNGVLVFFAAIVGFALYLTDKSARHRHLIALVAIAPFLFNVLTLFMGQSVIFIPHLTPTTFEWTLFNVRYGIMVAPAVSLFFAYLFWRGSASAKLVLAGLVVAQLGLYGIGYSKVISRADGTEGLSSAKRPDAEYWLREHYDGGLLMMDDFARTLSIIRSGVPMRNDIYVGNKPYWDESLKEPEKYARWIVMQKDDAVWKEILGKPELEGRLYKHFQKVYTSPDILIFKKAEYVIAEKPKPTLPYRFWEHQCIDTMKSSRDNARAWSTRDDTEELIEKELDAIKALGANCVSIGTPYDAEFLPYLKLWVAKARERELSIWFRGNWSAWEGWFGRRRGMTTEEHLTKTAAFIRDNPDLFRDGDIFTPAPEAENGGPFAPMTEGKYEAYRAFLVDEHRVAQEAFATIGKDVDTNWLSMSGWVGKNRLTKAAIDAMGGVVAIDHYVRTPQEMDDYIVAINREFGAKVAIGEFGAPVPDLNGNMSEGEQAEFVGKLLYEIYKNREAVAGINYWVAYGGSTRLLNDNYTQRPAAEVIKNYFIPGIVEGTITNTLGEPLQGVSLKTRDGIAQAFTDRNGAYAIALPAGPVELIAEASGYRTMVTSAAVSRNDKAQVNVVLEPEKLDFTYRRKAFEYDLRETFKNFADWIIFWR